MKRVARHACRLATAALALAGCNQRNPEYEAMSAPAPPPAAVLGPALDSIPLPVKLARMQGLLDDAVAHGITGGGSARIVAVKLLADRLLEVPPPFSMLKDGYSLEARLRQVEARADRILSELRREDADEGAVMNETRTLRMQVASLRRELALGGAPNPPPLDSLLATIPANPSISQYSEALGE